MSKPSVHCLSAGRRAQLAEDGRQVEFDRVLADAKCRGHCAIGVATGDEREHVMLAPGQVFDQWLIVFSVRAGEADDSIRQLDAIDEFDVRIGKEPLPERIERSRLAAA